jgi:hypothetical protein
MQRCFTCKNENPFKDSVSRGRDGPYKANGLELVSKNPEKYALIVSGYLGMQQKVNGKYLPNG